MVSTLLSLFGTLSQPSGPTSKEESCCVGGLRSTPKTSGVTVLFDEMTTILEGDWSSVVVRSSGSELERNSATFPDSEMVSPTLIWLRTVALVVKTVNPRDTLMSLIGSPNK